MSFIVTQPRHVHRLGLRLEQEEFTPAHEKDCSPSPELSAYMQLNKYFNDADIPLCEEQDSGSDEEPAQGDLSKMLEAALKVPLPDDRQMFDSDETYLTLA